jgi:hypothetical protein
MEFWIRPNLILLYLSIYQSAEKTFLESVEKCKYKLFF